MARRDLTFNTPNGAQDEESGVENPFVSSVDEESSSFGLNQQSSSSQLDDYNRMNNHMNEQNYGEAFNVYNGYYSCTGATTNLMFEETDLIRYV